MVSIRGTRILKDGGVSISTYERTVESRYDGKQIITYFTEHQKTGSYCFNIFTFKHCLIRVFLCIALIVLLTNFTDLETTWTTTTKIYASFCMYTFVTLFPIWLCSQFHNRNKYHAALHMVKNAYESLQRIPTVEECKKFSFYDRDCTLTVSLMLFVCYIPGFTFSFIPIDNSTLLYPFLCLLVILLFVVVVSKWKLDKYLLRPFLSRPTNIELTAVIECLTLLEGPRTKTIFYTISSSFDN